MPRVNSRLKTLPDRKPISDDEARDLLRAGWFLGQIILHYRIGKPRLRKIDRELRQQVA